MKTEKSKINNKAKSGKLVIHMKTHVEIHKLDMNVYLHTSLGPLALNILT